MLLGQIYKWKKKYWRRGYLFFTSTASNSNQMLNLSIQPFNCWKIYHLRTASPPHVQFIFPFCRKPPDSREIRYDPVTRPPRFVAVFFHIAAAQPLWPPQTDAPVAGFAPAGRSAVAFPPTRRPANPPDPPDFFSSLLAPHALPPPPSYSPAVETSISTTLASRSRCFGSLQHQPNEPRTSSSWAAVSNQVILFFFLFLFLFSSSNKVPIFSFNSPTNCGPQSLKSSPLFSKSLIQF